MPECTELERNLLGAVRRGDQNEITRLKAEIAYDELPASVRLSYRVAFLELRAATAKLNAIIEQIPDDCRGRVIERLQREAERLSAVT